MHNRSRLAIALPLLFAATTVSADETSFLKSLDGSWAGKGTVRTNAQNKPMNVACSFESRANGTSLSMQGKCRGLLLMSRAISADLTTSGARYSGVYVGPSGGRSGLSGARNGDTINLAVRWAKPVNGDRDADMTIEKIGSDGMRLTTIDRDPGSGRKVTTSQIDLQRRPGA